MSPRMSIPDFVSRELEKALGPVFQALTHVHENTQQVATDLDAHLSGDDPAEQRAAALDARCAGLEQELEAVNKTVAALAARLDGLEALLPAADPDPAAAAHSEGAEQPAP